MPPPAPTTFVQLCRTNNIAAVSANQRLQFLRDAATLASEGLTAKSLTERCAALSWARDSLQNSVDPDTWPTLLTPALYSYLHGLYTVPPYKGAPPTPSNERRLADIITLFTPADGAANAANAQQPPQDGININRQDGNANNAAPPPPPNPQNQTSSTSGAPHPSPSGGKRKWLMYDDLLSRLDPEVYQMLDLSSGMPYKTRVKLQESCKRGDMANLLDRTIAAAFSHQTLLSLSDGAHFDHPSGDSPSLAPAAPLPPRVPPARPSPIRSPRMLTCAPFVTIGLPLCRPSPPTRSSVAPTSTTSGAASTPS